MIEQEPEPGEPPPTPEADADQPVVSRDHGARTSATSASRARCSRSSPGFMFAVTLVMLHRRDLRVAEARGLSLASPEALSPMGQYLPVVALAVLAVVFAALSRVASQLLAPSATTDRQALALRVRHRARPRAARALPGALLPDRDDLHRLRHRDHLPLPLGGHLPGPRCLRARRDAALHGGRARVVRLPAEQRRPRLGPRQAGAAPVADGRRPSAPDHHGQAGGPRRPRATPEPTRRRPDGVGRRARASRGSTTTSSPASSRTS